MRLKCPARFEIGAVLLSCCKRLWFRRILSSRRCKINPETMLVETMDMRLL